MTDRDAREALVTASGKLVALGLNRGAAGNLSLRHGDGFLVTPSGVPSEQMRPEQIVEMGLVGSWSGPWKPSSEWRFHRDIYAARPEIGAVVHTHATAATGLACLGRGIPAFHYMVAVAGGPDVRCAPYATVGTQELSDHALAALEGRMACLLAHHGMITIGRSLDAAIAVAVEIEHLAEIYLRLLPLGEPPVLDCAAMTKVFEVFHSYGSTAQDKA